MNDIPGALFLFALAAIGTVLWIADAIHRARRTLRDAPSPTTMTPAQRFHKPIPVAVRFSDQPPTLQPMPDDLARRIAAQIADVEAAEAAHVADEAAAYLADMPYNQEEDQP